MTNKDLRGLLSELEPSGMFTYLQIRVAMQSMKKEQEVVVSPQCGLCSLRDVECVSLHSAERKKELKTLLPQRIVAEIGAKRSQTPILVVPSNDEGVALKNEKLWESLDFVRDAYDLPRAANRINWKRKPKRRFMTNPP